MDGLVNHISELNAVVESEGEHNPSNNAFYYEETVLDSEKKVCARNHVLCKYLTVLIYHCIRHCVGHSRLQSGEWALLENLQPK